MVVALTILHNGLSTTAALARYYQRCHHHFCVVISFFLSFHSSPGFYLSSQVKEAEAIEGQMRAKGPGGAQPPQPGQQPQYPGNNRDNRHVFVYYYSRHEYDRSF